ncbi:MAG: rRNA maturation RNase YbeY [Patescibacteria group bacterium]
MLTIRNTTKGKLPRLPFARMTEATLGRDYELSFVIVSPKKSRELNRTYRGKDSSTNILSFPLDTKEGEIFLDLAKARKEAPLFERNYSNFIGFLFIHALCHLKGFEHGSTMERQERKIRALFNI